MKDELFETATIEQLRKVVAAICHSIDRLLGREAVERRYFDTLVENILQPEAAAVVLQRVDELSTQNADPTLIHAAEGKTLAPGDYRAVYGLGELLFTLTDPLPATRRNESGELVWQILGTNVTAVRRVDQKPASRCVRRSAAW